MDKNIYTILFCICIFLFYVWIDKHKNIMEGLQNYEKGIDYTNMYTNLTTDETLKNMTGKQINKP